MEEKILAKTAFILYTGKIINKEVGSWRKRKGHPANPKFGRHC
jgi:hypothetical protein